MAILNLIYLSETFWDQIFNLFSSWSWQRLDSRSSTNFLSMFLATKHKYFSNLILLVNTTFGPWYGKSLGSQDSDVRMWPFQKLIIWIKIPNQHFTKSYSYFSLIFSFKSSGKFSIAHFISPNYTLQFLFRCQGPTNTPQS